MARPRKNEDTTAPWVVRDVPEFTREQVRAYARHNKMTMAEAIQLLVSRGISVGIVQAYEPALGVLRDMPDRVLAELARRVVEETERRRTMPPEEREAEENERLRAIIMAKLQPSMGDVDVKKMIAEILYPTEEPPA